MDVALQQMTVPLVVNVLSYVFGCFKYSVPHWRGLAHGEVSSEGPSP